MNKILSREFFQRPTLIICEDLIGKYLVRRFNTTDHTAGREFLLDLSFIITEVEAYDGFDDKASHAACGKTQRNEIMFESGGYIYIYLIYGMYWMLNIVTYKKNYPSAILVRGTKEISGPGRLTKHLNLDKSFNKKILSKQTGLWIEDRNFYPAKKLIFRTSRIGVNYAGPIWAKKPYRFILK